MIPSETPSIATSTRSSATIRSFSSSTTRSPSSSSSGSDDPAPAKHVVDHRQAAGAKQAERLLVVVQVADLVGVDEGEVEGLVGGHRAQGVERRAEPQVDPLRQPGLLEVAARDARPLLVHVAADQLAVVGQAAGDADRRVAGEGAELERAAGADRPHQQGHQAPPARGRSA